MDIELQASNIVESAAGAIGLRDGFPFGDPYLVAPPPTSSSDPILAAYLRECRQAGVVTAEVDSAMTERLTPFRDAERSYLGWLLTNRIFLDELRQFREVHRDLFADGRMPPHSIAIQASHDQPANDIFRESDDPTARTARDFCTRWRLRSMTGPVTFAPLSVQTPVGLPSMAAELSQYSGTLIYIPDIAPLPDRDQLRILLENATRQTIRSAEHLEEWYQLIRAGNLGRRSLNNFGALYRLQHYLRVLHSRYGERLRRQQRVVACCVGEHLSLSADQVRRLLQLINSRLGPNWLQPDQLSDLSG